MKELWRSESRLLATFMICSLFLLNSSFCCSLNAQGDPHGGLSNWSYEVGVENPSSSNRVGCDVLKPRHVAGRKLLQETPVRRIPPFQYHLSPLPSRNLAPLPPPSSRLRIPRDPPITLTPTPTPTPSPSPELFKPAPSLPPSTTTTTLGNSTPSQSSRTNYKLIVSMAIGGPILLLFLITGIICYRCDKVATVKPWATGLSGQLQRAFITGVPKLKRSELEAACEDFSNVIGSLSVCTLYKGTLSGGVEIAVASVAAASVTEWSNSLESQFRKKIDTLSKVNHKNFVSLLGYCEEEEPFTRMMVFEYASNGTLFEHLHIREAEHLDWETRLRIAMGMAYCLDHMHQLKPALAHRNLTSSSIYLTEDYAAKVSDFTFWDKGYAGDTRSSTFWDKGYAGDTRSSTPQDNVYSFGVVLFEMVTGKLPYSSGTDSLEDWASDYLQGSQSLREIVDPILRTYREDQLDQIEEVIKMCADPDLRQRPPMKAVSERLRVITGIGPDGAIPKLSPLWWAEVEILSSEAT